jgi:hypothetical protein
MNKYEGLGHVLKELRSYGNFTAVQSVCDKCIIRAKCSSSGVKNYIITPRSCVSARAFVAKKLIEKYLPQIKFEEVKK